MYAVGGSEEGFKVGDIYIPPSVYWKLKIGGKGVWLREVVGFRVKASNPRRMELIYEVLL